MTPPRPPTSGSSPPAASPPPSARPWRPSSSRSIRRAWPSGSATPSTTCGRSGIPTGVPSPTTGNPIVRHQGWAPVTPTAEASRPLGPPTAREEPAGSALRVAGPAEVEERRQRGRLAGQLQARDAGHVTDDVADLLAGADGLVDRAGGRRRHLA